jgi:hypothetical protein
LALRGLGSCFLGRETDAVPGHLGGREVPREQVQILLRDTQLAMGSNNVGVLGVLVVQGPELPALVELLLIVRKLGDMAENRDLLDEVLQSPGMD